ncbi:hypothetical protein LIER_21561 [Lithospermum erythrorhizon]|uniref:Uncharacterized protein n=1 Tax=Lithospermum erythrorhizon TaxID=34254 RepID=A0AAV3QRQ5_LITER
MSLTQAERKVLEAQQATDTAKGALESSENTLPSRIDQPKEEYCASDEYKDTAGANPAYCLCRFVRTYKDVSPSLVAFYEECIRNYPAAWFAPNDVQAPLSPLEEVEEEEEGLEAQELPKA